MIGPRLNWAAVGDRVRARATVWHDGEVIAGEGDEGTIVAVRGPGWRGEARVRWDWDEFHQHPEAVAWFEVGPFSSQSNVWVIVNGQEARD